jgi:molecular chaperone GrpE
MSEDVRDPAQTPAERAAGEGPVDPDRSYLDEDRTGAPIAETEARPAVAPPAAGSAAPSEPSVADLEARERSDVGSEQAGAVSALHERVAQLERELSDERDHATEYMQRWQRAQADLSNFRRRMQQEQEQLLSLAAAQSMALVLPALDSLERAFKVVPEALRQLTWIDGIALVDLQLRQSLEAQGVRPIEPRPAEQLDLARHQPIAEAETGDVPEGCVVEVVQRGYEQQGRVLRPALVRVARAPSGSSSGGPPSGAPPPGGGP